MLYIFQKVKLNSTHIYPKNTHINSELVIANYWIMCITIHNWAFINFKFVPLEHLLTRPLNCNVEIRQISHTWGNTTYIVNKWRITIIGSFSGWKYQGVFGGIIYKITAAFRSDLSFSMQYNAIDMMFDYRASNNVIVTSLVEDGWFLLDTDDFFPTKKPSSLGSGNGLSLCNIITTDDMLGRSSWCCCKHKKLIWRQRSISDRMQESFKQVSINFKGIFSFHNFHAWNISKFTIIICNIIWKVESQIFCELTCPTRFRLWSWWKDPRFFFPLNISNNNIPKLKTSDFTENKPSIAYSGAIYPLQNIIKNKTLLL